MMTCDKCGETMTKMKALAPFGYSVTSTSAQIVSTSTSPYPQSGDSSKHEQLPKYDKFRCPKCGDTKIYKNFPAT